MSSKLLKFGKLTIPIPRQVTLNSVKFWANMHDIVYMSVLYTIYIHIYTYGYI